MNELATYNQNLPDKIEDVTVFLLIAPAKLAKVKAEIRAIKNASLAKDVLRQKQLEERMLGEAILDAKVKVGEFTKAIPPSDGGRPKKTRDGTVPSLETKAEAVNNLGFSKKQVQRMETLANNRDLVEQVKAEARESETMPTATKVIELAQARKEHAAREMKRDLDEIDRKFDNIGKFIKALSNPNLYIPLDNEEILQSIVDEHWNFKGVIENIDSYISLLTIIKSKLFALKRSTQ